MTKIMLITSRLPYPNLDGRKNILSQYMEDFKEVIPDLQIINLSYVDNAKYFNEKPNIIDHLEKIDFPGIVEKIFNIILYTLILRKWPLQVSLFFSRKTKSKIRNKIKEYRPDYIFFDMIRVAEYLIDGHYQTIMSYDDLLSARYSRQSNWVEYTSIGNVHHLLPKMFRNIVNNKKIKKIILMFESKLTKKYEISISRKFKHLVFTSPKEATEFKRVTKHPSCIGIPMKFNVSKRNDARIYDKNKIVFTGKMDVAHNTSAVLFFCEKIWPRITEEMPQMKFYIVGSNPSKDILNLTKEYNNIIVTGEVMSIKDFISDAALLVAPLLFGTGIKTKIIEAMSLGVPVVTNEIGIEGIAAYTQRDYYNYKDEDELIHNIMLLVNDDQENNRISENSMSFVMENFSKGDIQRKWRQILI